MPDQGLARNHFRHCLNYHRYCLLMSLSFLLPVMSSWMMGFVQRKERAVVFWTILTSVSSGVRLFLAAVATRRRCFVFVSFRFFFFFFFIRDWCCLGPERFGRGTCSPELNSHLTCQSIFALPFLTERADRRTGEIDRITTQSIIVTSVKPRISNRGVKNDPTTECHCIHSQFDRERVIHTAASAVET